MAAYDKAAYAEQMKARTKELTDKLETGMKELYDSDKYKSYLNSISKFHNYSTKNIMLIHQQMPDASRVASYKTWKEKLNRQVKGGETGLYIYAPAKQKEPEKIMMEKLDPDTGTPLLDKNSKVIMEEMTPLSALNSPKFVLVPVFDVSQTVGDPLPELAENITGNVAHYEAFLDALKDVSTLPIVFEPMPENKDGYCEYGVKIGIREGMSETQIVSAVVHEMTHDKLHDKNKLPENAEPKKKRVKEIEAESISYVVCQHYGIETSPNSFGYLAEYGSRDMSEIKASLDIIRKEAGSLITAIDERFNAICQERGIDLTAKEPEQAAEQGDYLLPNIALKQSESPTLGRYGLMRMAYLKEHRPILYTRYILKEEMYSHCSEIEDVAAMRLIQIMTDLSEKNPPPNKAADPKAWTAHMNSLKAQAEEIILTELIYK